MQSVSTLPSASFVVFDKTVPLALEPSEANLMFTETLVVKPPLAILHVEVEVQALVSCVVVQPVVVPPASPPLENVTVESGGWRSSRGSRRSPSGGPCTCPRCCKRRRCCPTTSSNRRPRRW